MNVVLRQADRFPRIATALAVAAFVLIGHVWSLEAGLFLDDHAHYRQLKSGDWSFQSAVDSARLGIVGDVMDLWSHQESGLRFFRPIAFWILRAEYTIANWQPAIVHGFSLLWHWSAGMLVVALAFRCLGNRLWAALAGCFFVVHPGQVVTVYWIAAQTELFVVNFLLAATLCYARYSCWPLPLFGLHRRVPDEQHPTGHIGWLLAALLCFALAIGCRENAVVFSIIVFGTDLITGKIRHRSRWGAYVAIAVVVGLYAVLRSQTLGGFPLPGHPYLMRPSDPGFFAFIAHKVMYYLLGLFAYWPVIPIGGLDYLLRHPAFFYGSFTLMLAGLAVVGFELPRRRGLLFAPLWILSCLLPVLPVFASTHHLYLPSVGFVLLLTFVLARLAGRFADSTEVVRPIRRYTATLLIGLHLVGFAFGSWAFGWAYRYGTSAEDLVVEDIVASGRSIKPGDHLYFVNLPMLAYYTVPALEERLNVRPLYGHVLTFSPDIVHPETPTTLTQPDTRSIEVGLSQDTYFAGATGKALLEMMGLPADLKPGQTVAGPLFTTRILDADTTGIKRLRFEFAKELRSDGQHFFLCSSARMAYPLAMTQNAPVSHRTARKNLDSISHHR